MKPKTSFKQYSLRPKLQRARSHVNVTGMPSYSSMNIANIMQTRQMEIMASNAAQIFATVRIARF
jgi:tRNA C32,U32 (ribose-2'-O)-methylase TrmJ